MKRLLLIALVLVSLVLLVTGCDSPPQGVTYTVSGTFSFQGMYIASPALITVTQGDNEYTASATITPDDSSEQAGTFSIPNVPPGNYRIVAVFFSSYFPSDVICIVDAVETPVELLPGQGEYEWNATIDSLSVGDDTAIDLSLYYDPVVEE